MQNFKQRRILPEEPQPIEQSAEQPAKPVPKPAPTAHMLPFIIAGVLLVLVIGGFLFVWGRASASTPTAVTTTTPQPAILPPVRETIVDTAVPTPTPDCISAQNQLATLDSLLQQGKWEQAARAADDTLGTPHLCAGDVRPLTSRAVLAELNVIYNLTFEPLDEAGQQLAIDKFFALRERARLAGVAFPATLLQVADEARRISQHRLSIACIEQAYAEGTFNPELDRATTRLLVSAYYGVGYWYTQAKQGSDLYTKGLSYLVTSNELAVKYKTGQGEAGMLLTKLLGKTSLPPAYPSPLLTPTH